MPDVSAWCSASSSTTGPRHVLMRIALRFIIANSRVDIILRVTSFSGTCRVTTSEVRRSSVKRAKRTPSASSWSSVSRSDVVVADVHVEALHAARDLLADVAEADDAEPLALHLVGADGGEVGGAPLAGDDVVVVVHELLEHGEHEHDGVLGDGDGVGAAVVGDGHLGLARGLDVDPVVAGAGQLHQLQLGRGAEELVADAVARRAQVVLGVGGRIVELGLGGIGDDQLHAGRAAAHGRSP